MAHAHYVSRRWAHPHYVSLLSVSLHPDIVRQLELGFCLIPVSTDGTKRPAFDAIDGFKAYETRKPLPEEISAWFDGAVPHNVGVVTGNISGIIVVDLDDEDSYGAVLDVAPWLMDTTMIVKSGRGYHVYFRPDPTALALLGGHIDTSTFSLNGHTHHIKGQKAGYVVAPPSIWLPKPGEPGEPRTYHWINDCDPVVIDPAVVFRVIVAAGATRSGAPEAGKSSNPPGWVATLLSEPCPDGQRNDRATKLAGWFRNMLKYQEDVTVAILLNWSNVWCRPPMNEGELRELVSHKYRMYSAT